MKAKKDTDRTLEFDIAPGAAPAGVNDIAAVRERCRRLVRQRAMVSAGVAAVPIPGLDLVSDMRLFASLIDDINHEFGLSERQIARMRPRFRLIAYEAAISVGGMLVGKLVTRETVLYLLRRGGMKSVARQAGKLVPLAGQLVSAGIGFLAFRQIGYQHVDACASVARELVSAGIGADA